MPCRAKENYDWKYIFPIVIYKLLHLKVEVLQIFFSIWFNEIFFLFLGLTQEKIAFG